MISLKNTLSAIAEKISTLTQGRDFAVVTRWSSPSGSTNHTTSVGSSMVSLNPYMKVLYQSRATEGSWSANSTGIYVPHEGYVVVRVSAYYDGGGSSSRNGLYVFKNGSEICGQYQGYCCGAYSIQSYPIKVSEGDYITCKARSEPTSGTTQYLCLNDRASWISVEYV